VLLLKFAAHRHAGNHYTLVAHLMP